MLPNRADGYNGILAERILIAIGGGLITFAPYLTWVSVVFLGGVNLTALLGAAHAYQWISYLVTAVGVAMILVPVLVRSLSAVRTTALIVGSVLLLGGGFAIYGLIRAVSDSAGLGQLGVGPVAGLIGSVLLVVPPLVGISQRPRQPWNPGAPQTVWPVWLPAAAGVLIALMITWVPGHAGTGNYCGTPVGAAFKSSQRVPPEAPPASVQAQLSQDKAAVAAATSALAAQQSGGGQVQTAENTATADQAQAQQADAAANAAAGQASQDQFTVSSDEANVSGEQGNVGGDQATVGGDQAAVQADQQALSNDQAYGMSTSYDQQQLTVDQQRLATDQTTLAQDQKTLQADKASLAQAQSAASADQSKADAAQQTANQLDQQAQDALRAADNAASNAANNVDVAQRQLNDAQQQESTDEQSWQDSYQRQLASVTAYNSDLSACQHQADIHFVTAGLIAAAGGVVTAIMILRRRRRPPPPTWPSPAMVPPPPTWS